MTTVSRNAPGNLASWAIILGLHTLIVYYCAIHLSPWLIAHWFRWVVPLLHLPTNTTAGNWYLSHFELVTILPAALLGYFNVISLSPEGFRAFINSPKSQDRAAIWAAIMPTLVMLYKMLMYQQRSSVLYDTSMNAIEYFFSIQRSIPMPTVGKVFVGDPVRALTQLTVTAPFYAGVAYSLGGMFRWVVKHKK